MCSPYTFAPIATIVVAAMSWYIVNKQTNYREKRKEVFDLHKRILDTIEKMDSLLHSAQESCTTEDQIKILRVHVFTLQKYIENIIDLYLTHFDPSTCEKCLTTKQHYFDSIESILNISLYKTSNQALNTENLYKKNFYHLQSTIQEQFFLRKITPEPYFPTYIIRHIKKYISRFKLIEKIKIFIKEKF